MLSKLRNLFRRQPKPLPLPNLGTATDRIAGLYEALDDWRFYVGQVAELTKAPNRKAIEDFMTATDFALASLRDEVMLVRREAARKKRMK